MSDRYSVIKSIIPPVVTKAIADELANAPKKRRSLVLDKSPQAVAENILWDAHVARLGALCAGALRVLSHWVDTTKGCTLSDEELAFRVMLDVTPHIADEDAAMAAERDYSERGGDLYHACRTATGGEAIRVYRLITSMVERWETEARKGKDDE